MCVLRGTRGSTPKISPVLWLSGLRASRVQGVLGMKQFVLGAPRVDHGNSQQVVVLVALEAGI